MNTNVDNADRFGRGPEGLPSDDLEREFDAAIAARDRADVERAAQAKAAREGRPLQLVASNDTSDGPDLRGEFRDGAALATFLEAGRAIVTVRSRATGERRTFRFSRPDEDDARGDGRPRPIWVSLLAGPNNDGDYQFLGTIWPTPGAWTFKLSAKSRMRHDSPSVRIVDWVVKHLNTSPAALFRQAEFWHEGRCGRCGRRLTVPESIASGFGPECVRRVGEA